MQALDACEENPSLPTPSCFLKHGLQLVMEGKKNRNGGSGRTADCVTELRRGNTVLIVNGYFKRDTNETAADKMERVLRTESDLRAIV